MFASVECCQCRGYMSFQTGGDKHCISINDCQRLVQRGKIALDGQFFLSDRQHLGYGIDACDQFNFFVLHDNSFSPVPSPASQSYLYNAKCHLNLFHLLLSGTKSATYATLFADIVQYWKKRSQAAFPLLCIQASGAAFSSFPAGAPFSAGASSY